MDLKTVKKLEFIPLVGAVSGAYRIYKEISRATTYAHQAADRLKNRPIPDYQLKTPWDYLRVRKIVYGSLLILPIIGTIATLIKKWMHRTPFYGAVSNPSELQPFRKNPFTGEPLSSKVQSLFPSLKDSSQESKKDLVTEPKHYRNARNLFLADFVRGFQGGTFEGAYAFFQKNLSLYLVKHGDAVSQKVRNAILALKDLFYLRTENVQDDKNAILSLLQKNKRVIMEGGWAGKPGHQVLFDFKVIPGEGSPKVELSVTNTGDGAQYHPPDSQAGRKYYYRTLHLPPVPIERLRESRFFEVILPFLNDRIQDPKFLDVPFRDPNLSFSGEEYYGLMLQFWPSFMQSARVSNYGGLMRGFGCSVQSIGKWLKHAVDDDREFAKLNLGLKLQAFEESLSSDPPETPDFIEGISSKMSRKMHKMVTQGLATPQDNAQWQQLKKTAAAKVAELRAVNKGGERNLASQDFNPIETKKIVTDVRPLEIPSPTILESDQEILQHYLPTHQNSPEEMLAYLTKSVLPEIFGLAKVWRPNDRDLYARKANLLKALPSFDHPVWRLLSKDTATTLFSKFLHFVPEAYLPSPQEGQRTLALQREYLPALLNSWLIVFKIAEVQNIIPKDVLQEMAAWMSLLIEKQQARISFDDPKRIVEFSKIVAFLNEAKGDRDFENGRFAEMKHVAPGKIEYMQHIFQQIGDFTPQFAFELKLAHLDDTTRFGGGLNNVDKELNMLSIKHGRLYEEGHPLSLLRHVGCLIALCLDKSNYRTTRDIQIVTKEESSVPSKTWVADAAIPKGKALLLEGYIYPASKLPTPPPVHALADAQEKVTGEDLNLRISAAAKGNSVSKISREEQRDLLAIVNYTPELKVPQILRFFETNAVKLVQPEYQDIFDWLLFNSSDNILKPLFQANSPVLDLLFEFVQKGYRASLGEKVKPRLATFFFKLHMRLILEGLQAGDSRIAERFDQWKRNWDHILKVAFGKSSGLGKLVSETVMSSLSFLEDYPQLTRDRGFLELLTSTLLGECSHPSILSSNPDGLPLAYGNSSFRKLLVDCGEEKSKAIIQAALNRVLRTDVREFKWLRGKHKIVTDEGDFLLAQRLFIAKKHSEAVTALPQEVRSNSKYQALFGTQGFLANTAQTDKGMRFQITSKGIRYNIFYDAGIGDIRIQKEVNGDIYQFYNGSLNEHLHCKSEVLAKALAVKTNFWIKVTTGEVNIFDDKKGKLLGIASSKGIERLIDGRRLLLGELDSNHKLTKTLERFEDKGYILPWISRETGRLALLELPRFGLSFAVKESGQGQVNYFSEQYPGYKIALQQNIRALRGFDNYLVLENQEGKRKVLVPTGPIDEHIETPFTEQKNHSNFDKSNLNQKFVALNLPAGGENIERPEQLFESLYLSYIYLKTGQYREAFRLIQESHLFFRQVLGNDEKQVIEWMIFSSNPQASMNQMDAHPNAVAIRLHLYQWLKENPSSNFSAEQTAYIKSNYITYMNLENNVDGIMRLPNAFLMEVDEKKEVERTITLDFPLKDTQWLAQDMRQKIVDAFRLEQHPSLNTLVRPGEAFIENFLLYYAIARADSTQPPTSRLQEELREILVSCARDKSEPVALFHRILTAVLCSCNLDFPTTKELTQLLELPESDFHREFAKRVVDPAEKCVKDRKMHFSLFVNPRPQSIDHPQVDAHKDKSSRKITIAAAPTMQDPLLNPPRISPEAIPNVPALLEHSFLRSVTRDLTEDFQAMDTLKEIYKERFVDAEDATSREEGKRILEGLEEYRNHLQNLPPTEDLLTKDPNQITRLDTTLKDKQEKLEASCRQIGEKALKIARDTKNHPTLSLEVTGRLREEFDLETLLIAFGRGEKKTFLEMNPTLTESDLAELSNLLGEYALKLSAAHQIKRGRKKLAGYIDLLEKGDEHAIAEESRQVLSILTASRTYDPMQHPRILIFELFADLIIRKDQFLALMDLSNPYTAIDKLFEAETGFGKSKILAPLWLLLTADKRRLAIMSIPEALFKPQTAYLQRILYKAFRLFGVELNFDRSSSQTAQNLQQLKAELLRAKQEGKPVFSSDRSLHNLLVLKAKELLADISGGIDGFHTIPEEDNPKTQSTLEILKLRSFIKRSSPLFVDEPHISLNDKHENNYAIGRITFFAPFRMQLALDIYQLFFQLPQFAPFQVDCWKEKRAPSKEEKQPLTESSYHAALKPAFIEAIWKNRAHFLPRLSIEKEAQVLAFLNGVNTKEFEHELKKWPDKILAKKIKVLYDQIHHYLPVTLMRNCNEHYGFADARGDRTAIPVQARGNPKKGNEFCTPDEILNFTIQGNLKTPIEKPLFHAFIDDLVQQAMEEMGCGKALENTIAHQKFQILIKTLPGSDAREVRLMNMSETEKNVLWDAINNNLNTRLQFIGLRVLPMIKMYKKKAISTPHLLAAPFYRLFGASATMDSKTIPTRLIVEEKKMSIAKTLVSLYKKYERTKNFEIDEIPGETSEEILSNLLKLYPSNVLIEIGGELREFKSDKKIARQILKETKFPAVSIFDHEGHPIVLQRNRKNFEPLSAVSDTLKPSEIYRVFGQNDIVGRDEDLPMNSDANVLISENTTRTLLVQGLGRLRGIHNGQNPRLKVTKNSAKKIKEALCLDLRKPLTLKDIFHYCSKYQVQKVGNENFRSLRLKWDAIIENHFWDFVDSFGDSLNVDHLCTIAEMFFALSDMMLQDTEDDPLKRVSVDPKKIPVQEAIAILKQQYEAKLQKLGNIAALRTLYSPEKQKAILKEMDNAVASATYPAEVALNVDSDRTQTADATAEQVTAADIQAQKQIVVAVNAVAQAQASRELDEEVYQEASAEQNVADPLAEREPLPYDLEARPLPIKQFLVGDLERFQLLFSDELYAMPSVFLTFTGDSVGSPGFLNGYYKPLDYLWISYNGQGDAKVSICDVGDAKQILKKREGKGVLWLINHGVVKREENPPADLRQNRSFLSLQLQAKVLNGDLLFNDEEERIFESWIDTREKFVLLREFLTRIQIARPKLPETSGYERLMALGRKKFQLE